MAWFDDTDSFHPFDSDPFSSSHTDPLFDDFGFGFGGSAPHDGGYDSDVDSFSRYSLPNVDSFSPLFGANVGGDRTAAASSSSSLLGAMHVTPAPGSSSPSSSSLTDVRVNATLLSGPPAPDFNDTNLSTNNSSSSPFGYDVGGNMTREMEDAAAFSFLNLDSDSDGDDIMNPFTKSAPLVRPRPSVFNFDLTYAKMCPQPENSNYSHPARNTITISIPHQVHPEPLPSAPLLHDVSPFLEAADFLETLTSSSPFVKKCTAVPNDPENMSTVNSDTEVNDKSERFVELDFDLPTSSSSATTPPSPPSLSSNVSRASSAPSSPPATPPTSSRKPRRRPPQLTINISSSDDETDDDVPLISTVTPRPKSKSKSRGTPPAAVRVARQPRSAPHPKSLRKTKVASTPKQTRSSRKRKRTPQSAPAKSISTTQPLFLPDGTPSPHLRFLKHEALRKRAAFTPPLPGTMPPRPKKRIRERKSNYVTAHGGPTRKYKEDHEKTVQWTKWENAVFNRLFFPYRTKLGYVNVSAVDFVFPFRISLSSLLKSFPATVLT